MLYQINIKTIQKIDSIEAKTELVHFMYEEALCHSLSLPSCKLKESELYSSPYVLSVIDELSTQIESKQMSTGSFYTNKNLVNQILNEFHIAHKKILDPAGGTGNFVLESLYRLQRLWQTPSEMICYIKEYIYMNELKHSSIKVCIDRIRLFSLYAFNEDLSEENINILFEHFTQEDFLLDFHNREGFFDIVLGNPPYLGAKSLGKDYSAQLKRVFGYSDDLYSLFTIKALSLLNSKGKMGFVTSSTFLTISTKQAMREALSVISL